MLIKKSSGWQAETYEWNADQTDAVRKVARATKVLTTTVNGQTQTFNYLIPNLNQCQNCHNNNYYSKGVGLIKFTYQSTGSRNIQKNELSSYKLY